METVDEPCFLRRALPSLSASLQMQHGSQTHRGRSRDDRRQSGGSTASPPWGLRGTRSLLPSGLRVDAGPTSQAPTPGSGPAVENGASVRKRQELLRIGRTYGVGELSLVESPPVAPIVCVVQTDAGSRHRGQDGAVRAQGHGLDVPWTLVVVDGLSARVCAPQVHTAYNPDQC